MVLRSQIQFKYYTFLKIEIVEGAEPIACVARLTDEHVKSLRYV